MLIVLPSVAKEQLLDAGLRLVVPWLYNLEFQQLAAWPQLHFGETSNTAITQKSRAAVECVQQAALALKRVLPNNDSPSLVFADDLFQYSGRFYSAAGYFQPLEFKNLPAGQHRFAMKRILGDNTKLPLTGNFPVHAFLLELSNLHRQLFAAWQTVYGLSHKPSRVFMDRLDELAGMITELRALCLQTHESQMSAFAMTLVQLLLAVEDDLDLSWLDIPTDDVEAGKLTMVELVSTEWPQLMEVVSTGMREFLDYLPFVPVGLESPHVFAAITSGKLVVNLNSNRVHFKGEELTSCFEKENQRAFETLVDYCRAVKRRGLVDLRDYPQASENTFRGWHLRLQKVHESLVPYLDKGARKQTYRLTLPPSEIVLIERKPGFNDG